MSSFSSSYMNLSDVIKSTPIMNLFIPSFKHWTFVMVTTEFSIVIQ